MSEASRLSGVPVVPGEEGYVLFFTPEASIVPHFAMQALVARIVQEKGHKVLFVRCHGIYSRCVVMDMYLLPYEDPARNKAQVCDACVKTSEGVLQAYGLENIDLKDFLDAGVIQQVLQIMEAAPADLAELEFDGVPFGKISCLDFVLATKVSNFKNLSADMRGVWKTYIQNSILTYLLTRRMLDRIPVRAVVHHEDYSLLLAARLAAGKRGIPSIHMGFTGHNGNDRRRVFFMKLPGYGEDQRKMSEWDRWRDLCLTPEMAKEPMDDILGRLGALSTRVYSPKKTFTQIDLHGQLGLSKRKKLLVAFTSSLDERLAGDYIIESLNLRMVDVNQPFADQIEWLKALNAFVAERDDYQLVVRVHPREGANQRESRVSEHLARLQDAFERPLRNAVYVWPGMEVSSYDLAEIADLVLTAWTTMGLEMSRLAVPVLASTYGLGPRPNDDFHAWAPTPAEYFAKIEEIVRRPPALETVQHSFRWHELLYLQHTLDFRDVIPARDFHGFIAFRMPAEADHVVDAIINDKDVLALNLSRLKALQGPGVETAEREMLRLQLRRALYFLCAGQEKEGDYRLHFCETGESPDAFRLRQAGVSWPADLWVLLASGSEIHFLSATETRTRVSPMCRRIGLLGCHQILSAGAARAPREDNAGLAKLAALLDRAGSESGPSNPAPGRRSAAHQSLLEVTALRDAGKSVDGLKRIAEAIAAHGESPELLNIRGHLESMGGDDAAAKSTFARIASNWPDFVKSHLNLAVLCWKDGDESASLLHLAKALELDPEDRDVVRSALVILKGAGLQGEARTVLASYARSNPQDARQLAAILDG